MKQGQRVTHWVNLAVWFVFGVFGADRSAEPLPSRSQIPFFFTQMPVPKEVNGDVSNTFVSVVSLFGNHLADTGHAGRGGDLWLLTTNGGLVNLTRKAGFGTTGSQDGIGIGVPGSSGALERAKGRFSMVLGSPTNASDARHFYWQLYEVTNLSLVIANTNVTPLVVEVSNQPTNFNNVSPCYGTDGRDHLHDGPGTQCGRANLSNPRTVQGNPLSRHLEF